MADTKQQKTGAKPSKRVLENKKSKKRQSGDGNEPTKEEYAIAKYVRFNCSTKTTTFGHGMSGEDVRYFVGSKAVDCLMESKWSASGKKASKKNQPLFADRQACVDYMQQLLMKGLFFRAKKLVPKVKDKTAGESGEKKKDQQKKTTETKEETTTKSPKASNETEMKRRKKEKEQKDDDQQQEGKEKDEAENEKGKEKTSTKSRKVRLDFHAEQLFIDGPSIYVWKYDPTPLKTFLLGLGIVLGAIALCLFPLWPLQIRAGVYYVSLAAMGLFGAFIGLVALRSVMFGIIWMTTLGRHHFWLLPNLTEDCGVLESFQPLYSYKHVASGGKPTEDKEKKKKKEKKSDSEEESAEEDTRDVRDDRASESESENEEHGRQSGDSATASEDVTSSDQGSQSSADEAGTSSGKTKTRRVRREDGHDSNNGDFEFVEGPPNGE